MIDDAYALGDKKQTFKEQIKQNSKFWMAPFQAIYRFRAHGAAIRLVGGRQTSYNRKHGEHAELGHRLWLHQHDGHDHERRPTVFNGVSVWFNCGVLNEAAAKALNFSGFGDWQSHQTFKEMTMAVLTAINCDRSPWWAWSRTFILNHWKQNVSPLWCSWPSGWMALSHSGFNQKMHKTLSRKSKRNGKSWRPASRLPIIFSTNGLATCIRPKPGWAKCLTFCRFCYLIACLDCLPLQHSRQNNAQRNGITQSIVGVSGIVMMLSKILANSLVDCVLLC